MTLMEKIKDAAGIEGDLRSFVKPMAAYTCANITLGGAGYCIVRISPDGVVNEYHSILDPEYCTSIKMR